MVTRNAHERHRERRNVRPELVPLCNDLVCIGRVSLNLITDHDHEIGFEAVDLFHRAIEYRPVLVTATGLVAENRERERIGISAPRITEHRSAFRHTGKQRDRRVLGVRRVHSVGISTRACSQNGKRGDNDRSKH